MHAVFVVICFLPTVILRTAQSRIQIAKSRTQFQANYPYRKGRSETWLWNVGFCATVRYLLHALFSLRWMTLWRRRWTTSCCPRRASRKSSLWTTKSTRRWTPSTVSRPAASSSSASPRFLVFSYTYTVHRLLLPCSLNCHLVHNFLLRIMGSFFKMFVALVGYRIRYWA